MLQRRVYRRREKNCAEPREKLEALVLDNDAIWARERSGRRLALNVILIPYYALCWVLDAVFDGRPIQRFWFLETVRMPYSPRLVPPFVRDTRLVAEISRGQTGTLCGGVE